MNILDALREDHRKVIELFSELEETETGQKDDRRRLFSTLRDELVRHAHAEEKIFYAQLRRHEEAREDADDAIDEHHEVEQLLQRMESMDVDSDDFMDSLGECRELVESHVEEEESRIFSEADDLLHDRLDELGDAFEDQKKREA